MSYRRTCGPKFQNPFLYVTGSLQIGTHLNNQLLLTRSARGFHAFHSDKTKSYLVRLQWIDVKFDVIDMQRIHVYI